MLRLAASIPRSVSSSLGKTFLRGPFHAYFSSTTESLGVEMETVNTTERLRELRRLMKEHKVDVYGMVIGSSLIRNSFLYRSSCTF